MTLTITHPPTEQNAFYKELHIFKRGRRTFAKVYTRHDGTFAVTINGLQWVKNSFEEAKDHIKEMNDLMYERVLTVTPKN